MHLGLCVGVVPRCGDDRTRILPLRPHPAAFGLLSMCCGYPPLPTPSSVCSTSRMTPCWTVVFLQAWCTTSKRANTPAAAIVTWSGCLFVMPLPVRIPSSCAALVVEPLLCVVAPLHVRVSLRFPALWAQLNREAVQEAGLEGQVAFFTRSGSCFTASFSCVDSIECVEWNECNASHPATNGGQRCGGWPWSVA